MRPPTARALPLLHFVSVFVHTRPNSRYERHEIYTYTGAILLAINPFFRIALYSDDHVKRYQADGRARVYDPDYMVRPRAGQVTSALTIR